MSFKLFLIPAIFFYAINTVVHAEIQKVDGVEVAFDKNCDELLISNILKAKNTVYGAIYSLTNDEIVDALINRAEKRVQIKLKIDRKQSDFAYTKILIKKMQASGIAITLISMKKGDHMHHKFAVIDKKIVITGSFNWTYNASKDNFENLVVIESKNIAEKFIAEWNRIEKKGNK